VGVANRQFIYIRVLMVFIFMTIKIIIIGTSIKTFSSPSNVDNMIFAFNRKHFKYKDKYFITLFVFFYRTQFN